MDRVPRSGTRIVYGSGATFQYQDSIWIGCHVSVQGYYMDWVPRSGTRIVYEDRSVTFRHKDSIWIGCHVPVPG